MPTPAETAYARMQRKIKLEQERLAQMMKRIANQKKRIAASAHRAGAFVRNKYLSDPFIIRLLGTHGGLRGQNMARLAIAIGKQHVQPTMTIGRNIKAQNNAKIVNAKRQYNAWYNSLTPNQKKQQAKKYNNNLNGAGWYNLNIIRNMNVTNGRRNHKEFVKLPLYYASQTSAAPRVKNLKNLIWKRNLVAANWKPIPNRTYGYYRAFTRLQRAHDKNYYMNGRYLN
jgi:hypothetical protein